MLNKTWKCVTTLCLCGLISAAVSGRAEAVASHTMNMEVGVETSSSYIVKIDAPSADLHAAKEVRSGVTGKAVRGETYEVLSYSDGWVKVNTGRDTGYLKISGQATVVETTREKVDEEAALRAEVIEYALQFVGNRYVYGGTDPNRGVDCSGFTSYVMRHAAGVSLSHSSVAQAGEGKAVSGGKPRPGDLIFYSNGSRINHVAIYIGDEKVVHASTAKTGIKISKWNYRNPAKVVDVLS